jgi:hypothetical protein
VGAIVKTGAAGYAQTAVSITNSGTVTVEKLTLDLLGPVSNPTITNLTTGLSVTFSGNVASTKHLIINTGTYTALNDGSNVINTVTHTGGVPFLNLAPGINSLVVQGSGSDANTALTVSFYPAFA